MVVARRVRLHHDLFNRVAIDWMADPMFGAKLRVECRVPDRRLPQSEDGRDVPEIPTMAEIAIPDEWFKIEDADEAARWLADLAREMLIRAATHEIDEMLVVDGSAIFDPHRGEGTVSPSLLDALHPEEMQSRLRATYARDRMRRRSR